MLDPRYPIGQFNHPGPVTDEEVSGWIKEIEVLPSELRTIVDGLTDSQLDTRYRQGGWTIRQVVHHICDSHTNSYVRFKWALTEDEPVIKTYDEARWAELSDYQILPVTASLDFLDVLHERWVVLLRSLKQEQLGRRLIHPDTGPTDLSRFIGFYAWHGRHHLAHIKGVIQREGWNVVSRAQS